MSEITKQRMDSIFDRRLLLGAILILSALVRVAVALFLGDSVEVMPGIADQQTYHVLAQRLLDGHGFSFAVPWWPATRAGEPTAHWSYLYTYYLSGIYALLGVKPLAARIVQALVVGLLQPFLAYKLGERVFNPNAGLIAAAITAFYAYFIYYSAALMTEAFFITAVMGALYLAIRISDESSREGGALPARLWGSTLALAITLAIATLFRQLILLFVPFLFIWLGWNLSSRIGTRKALLLLGVVSLVLVLVILPFSINNYNRFGTFVLLNTNSGFAFFWANHPIHGTHFQPILSAETASYGDLIPGNLASLNEAELDKALLRAGLGFVSENPVRYLLLSLSRIPAYFQFWPTADSSLPSNVLRVLSFGITLPFMLYGLITAIRVEAGLSRMAKGPLGLLFLFTIVYTGIHVLSWSLVRYRLPVDAILITFAGFAGAMLVIRWKDHQELFETGLMDSLMGD